LAYLYRGTRGIGWSFVLLASILTAATDACAAVAPHYQRVHQFAAVMSVAGRAASKLSSQGLIDRIERKDEQTFYFWAGRCFVAATLEELPEDEPPRAGAPTDYRVSLGAVHCQ